MATATAPAAPAVVGDKSEVPVPILSKLSITDTSNKNSNEQQQQQQQQQQQSAEECKRYGNEYFSKNQIQDAITSYTDGINVLQVLQTTGTKSTTKSASDDILLIPTLYSNRAMCYIKCNNYTNCINDCTLGLQYMVENTASTNSSTNNTNNNNTSSVRSKLLFRRAKAYFMLFNTKTDTSTSNTSNSSNSTNNDLLQDSAKDLLAVLQIEPKNVDATKLLTTVRSQHQQMSNNTTPVSKTISNIRDYYLNSINSNSSTTNTNTKDMDQCLHHIKILLGLIDDDLVNVTIEVGRLRPDCIQLLFDIAGSISNSCSISSNTKTSMNIVDSKHYKIPILAIRCIAQCGNYPQFVRTTLMNYQSQLTQLLQSTCQTLVSLLLDDSDSDNTNNSSIQIKSLSDIIVSLLSCWVRIIVHVDRDDPTNDNITLNTNINEQLLLQSLHTTLQVCCCNNNNNNNNTVFYESQTTINMIQRALFDVIGTYTCGNDRDSTIRTVLQSCNVTDKTIPIPKSAMDIHQMTPKQLAHYRQRTNTIQQRNIQWGINRCLLLFTNTSSTSTSTDNIIDNNKSIISILLSAVSQSYDHTIRREGTVTIGKVIATLADDDKIRKRIEPYLSNSGTSTKKNPPMIEEIVEEVYNDDGEIENNDNDDETKVADDDDNNNKVSLDNKMIRAVIVCAMLLTTSKELGSWALGTGWYTSIYELSDLIHSADIRAMCLASEVVSAAATVESVRSIVSSLVSGGDMELLLLHPDRDIRSAAASAVAKLGLASANSSNSAGGIEQPQHENDLISMLTGACELLADNNDDDNNYNYLSNNEDEKTNKEVYSNNNTKTKSKGGSTTMNHLSSHATSSVERGVEMMTYLMANTIIKEEICGGFTVPTTFSKTSTTGDNISQKTATTTTTALQLLVQTADKPGIGETITGFGLASIFRNISITNLELRKLMFEGKDVTMEQYDELQRMQKTEEEKEFMDNTNTDNDSKELRDERIRKMSSFNVPRALVQLATSDYKSSSSNSNSNPTTAASEKTLEQIILTMSQMANEKTVRGSMIQQGCLSSCIKLETNESPTDTDTMKNIFRMCRHTISKLLITTNPHLLTSAQRLGSIKPLIRLVRDSKAKDIQHFEALLALTNIASSGEDAKNRIVSEKGIAALHYIMFNDHIKVKRAATEALCNLVPHQAMLEHLQNYDNLRLWLAFGEDYEDNDNDDEVCNNNGDENEKYVCARAASGCIAMATQQNIDICTTLVSLPRFEEQILHMMESGRVELMYRSFCIVYNLYTLHGTDDNEKNAITNIISKLSTTKIVPFTRAYVENYIRNGIDSLDFSQQEKLMLPTVFDIAKNIIRAADP